MRRMFWMKVATTLCLFTFALPLLLSAQDTSQTMSVTPPPTRRIERPPADANPADLEERGDQLRGEKAYLDALDYYQAAVKKLPKGPAAAIVLNKMGITQFQMQRYEDSKKSYEKAIKYDKTYANAYNNLGVVFYRNKRYGRAIKFYRKAIGLDAETASFHNNVAAAYFADKQVEKAMPEYQKALQLDPDIFERRSTSGIVAQIAPEDRAHYSYLLAKMYAQTGQFDRALLYLRRAIEDGYKDVNNALQDVEFAQLRKDPRFSDLMTLQRPPSIQ
jgi:tetratricopeptide (TPR) repeat protein